MALDVQVAAALRARLAFLRDMGVYDLYRRGDGLAGTAVPQSAPVETVAEHMPAAVAPLAASSPEPTPLPAAHIAALPPEDSDIAARKRELPTLPPVLDGPVLAPGERAAALQAIRNEIGDCKRCPLAFEGRHSIVFGDGDPNARLLFVGEGPGADEDMQGLPFVGKAGQLLNNMIGAMGLRREDVYIANIVKCRPPSNRVPEPIEANTCTPFLFEQLGVIRPEVIVALGATAATYLLGDRKPLAGLRGRVHPAFSTKLIVTYHPAYLLRDPRQKKEAWADLQIAMRELGLGKA